MKCDVCGNNYSELHKVGRANLCAGCYGSAYGDGSKAAPVPGPPLAEAPSRDAVMTDEEKLKSWKHSRSRLCAEMAEIEKRIDTVERLIAETEMRMSEKKAREEKKA